MARQKSSGRNMAARNGAPRSPQRSDPTSKADRALLSGDGVDIYGGEYSLNTVRERQKSPTEVKRALKEARYWQRENWFVRELLGTRCDFYNHGIRFLPIDKKKSAKSKLDTWLSGSGGIPGMAGALQALSRRCWGEFEQEDNAVALWMDYNAPAWNGTNFKGVKPAKLFEPECTNYSDKMGMEVMKISFHLTAEEMKERGFPDKAIRRYTQEVKLDPVEWGEHFKVLRRDGFEGYGWPSLHSVFKPLAQNESMEVGEQALALAGRRVEVRHTIGFEPKISGLAQGNVKVWKWDKVRSKEMKEYYRKKPFGLIETTAQFDHKTVVVWIDPKLYEGKKWETVVNRLLWWGGPLAFMYVAKSIQPFLLQMLKTRAQADRALMGPFLEEVINASFKPPVPLRIEWSDQCFDDARLAWDMAKVLMTQGPLSLTSSLERAGYNPEEEAERKKDEKGRRDELIPLLMPAGSEPKAAGRPSGTKDNTSPLS